VIWIDSNNQPGMHSNLPGTIKLLGTPANLRRVQASDWIMRYAFLCVVLARIFALGQGLPVDSVVPLEGVAIRQAPGQAQRLGTAKSFWIAYRVEVKANIAIDTHEVKVPWDASVHGPDVSVNVSPFTPALGVFVRYEVNRVAQVEVLNLERRHDFGSLPVFWLGKRSDVESLGFLQMLLKERPDLGVGLVRATGVHRNSSSAEILKTHAVLTSLNNHAREEALCWIGQSYGHSSFLATLASDGALSLDERSAAVLALLESPDPAAQTAISQLRASVKERQIQSLIERYSRRIANSAQ
jgi:hypothetical protein